MIWTQLVRGDDSVNDHAYEIACAVEDEKDEESDGGTLSEAQYRAITQYQKIRASILFAGSLIARCGKAVMQPPGGDVIGRRRLEISILCRCLYRFLS